MKRFLVIGYGNPYRRDDGVAFHVINALRRQLGLGELAPEEDGQEEWGQPIDTLMQHQLLPELAPLLNGYDGVIFVDAHTGAYPEPLRTVPVQPQYGFHAVTHHVSPAMLLSLAHSHSGQTPEGWLVSIKGEDFDFGDQLSAPCSDRLPAAVQKILELTRQ